ncbi:hypothetical protein [Hydrogenimonas urashimensis]|uniref:hypothetical protein n=1 Tax=Hydrogenimonas urashimensis TaxID=2740515 RepID=UPI0019150B3E|nr:hypothetical protein [Hydrogenimonas urashimensis]
MRTRMAGWALLLLLTGNALHATSHCYKQRSNCFVVEDGKERVQMYSKRDKFVEVAKKHDLSKARIERMIKIGEGHEEEERHEDLRDERGYYGGVYWPHPIYAYPPYYWDDHPHHEHPHHPEEKPPHHPGEKPPHRPGKNPVTIQPTENPFFNRPRPERPSTQPIQRPSTKPVARPQKPAVRPRPVQRPRPAPRPRPRPRPVRRAR